jgi:sortase A
LPALGKISPEDQPMIDLAGVRPWDWGKAAIVAALAAGVVCVSEAAWIHAKALLAQTLIKAAWRRELSGSGSTQPWPWADTHPLARLTIGEDDRAWEFFVLEGSSGRNLAFGPAHDPASVMPGDVGNSVIEGHRDTHFSALRHLKLGDTLHVETAKRQNVNFVVTDIRIVDSRRARIALRAERPRLTLVTCYPFDAVVPGGPLRLVISADLSEPRPALGPITARYLLHGSELPIDESTM